METETHSRPNVQESRIALFKDLVDCLKREREILTDLNVQNLWAVLEEKQGILHALEALPFREAGSGSQGEHGKADPLRLEAHASALTVDRLKEEIRERTRENADFIRDSLQFVDELVALVAGAPSDNGVYGPNGEESRAHRARLYGREV
jgi:hypothetical protein